VAATAALRLLQFQRARLHVLLRFHNFKILRAADLGKKEDVATLWVDGMEKASARPSLN